MLLFPALPASGGRSSTFTDAFQRNALELEGLSLGSPSLGLQFPGCFFFCLGARLHSGAEMGMGQGAAAETASVALLYVQERVGGSWMGFAALIASTDSFLVPASKCCLVDQAVPILGRLLPPRDPSPCPVCSQPPGHNSCTSAENGKEELIIKDSEERFDIISNLVIAHLVGIIDIHMYIYTCVYAYV